MKNTKKKRIFKTAAAVLVFAALCFICTDSRLTVREYTVESEKTADEISLLLITDLHSVFYGKNQSKLIQKIDEINPDVILLGGDIYDDVRSDDGSDALLSDISGRYKCFYTSGNHEYWSMNISGIKQKIREYGITVLEGESAEIGDNIVLWGIDDPECENSNYRAENDKYNQLSSCSTAADSSKLNILLSHRPERAEEYKNTAFDAVLCGHAHGGQWRIPYILNGLYAPNQGFFPKYAGGEYDLNGKKMIVSRGLALSYIPRIFNPPELVILKINSGQPTPTA